ncbi:restriction endonuclease subunit S [Candidatus Poseidonia alphae]|nr:restriction endonuclease subunit S [Candidatus Poseidonia alphae]
MSWPVVKLGDHIQILSGFAFNSKKFSKSEGVPLIRIRDVIRGFTETYYDGDFDDKYLINQGDLLVGMDGQFNAVRWGSCKALLNQRVCKIEALEKLDERYLGHLLPNKLKEIEDKTAFVTVKHLSLKKIKEIEFPLPPIDEQKRIADILDKADELKCNSEQSKLIRQSLIRSTFIDMFEREIENETHLPLEQICKIVDCPHSTPQYSDEPTGYYCVRSQDLTDEGELIFGKMLQVTRDTFEHRISRHMPKAGDVLFLREGSIGRCAIIPSGVEICLGQRIMILSPFQNIINPTFLHNLILSDRFQHSLSRFKLGTTAGRVNIKDLRGLLIPTPELSKQIQFGKIANSLNRVPYAGDVFSLLSKSSTQSLISQ